MWARDLPSAADVVTGSQGVTVMDLGGFGDPLEPVSIALEVVEELWAQRDRRVPTLLVIDEAHNLCRADPGNPVATLLLDRLIQIAAEGRKYGLWLLLSSQRPSKIHPQILSQCDNLMLMRMNSPDDIVELGRTFGFAPQQMLRASDGVRPGRGAARRRVRPGADAGADARAAHRRRAAATSRCRSWPTGRLTAPPDRPTRRPSPASLPQLSRPMREPSRSQGFCSLANLKVPAWGGKVGSGGCSGTPGRRHAVPARPPHPRVGSARHPDDGCRAAPVGARLRAGR